MANGLPRLKITDVKTILTAPNGIRLVIVKVETSEAGLYGLGCATFTQRPMAVATSVDEYLKPFLMGKDPDRIEDIYQSAFVSSYWRNGPVLNNALSGIDMALWDIKGKRANMPVYDLLGGKCREAAPLYAHAGGRDPEEVADSVRKYMEEGYRHVRAQVSVPGYSVYGAGGGKVTGKIWKPLSPEQKGAFEPTPYVNAVIRLFDHLRSELGNEVELLHDVHERIPPIQAIGLAKELEKYRLFFLEDVFAPEDIEYLRILRPQTSTPIAISELFNNMCEYVPMIKDRLFDFIRCHLSQIGGISPAKKLASFCEFFGIRTAWHGPGDVSPVGHAANLALDLSCYNFGVQERHVFRQETQDVFPGCPELRDGYLWSNDKPGLGIDIDEELAAKFPFPEHPFNGAWPPVRKLDGTVIRP
ncbi:starvation-sensing protein RspA [Candidatus Poribacteria bacterium]|nr:starvation-sensing protein RspA [Candidatus Poribacteria bacterium]